MSDYKYNPLIDEDEDDEDNLDLSDDQALALGRVVDESTEDFIDYEVLCRQKPTVAAHRPSPANTAGL
jgi:hypothetical protein